LKTLEVYCSIEGPIALIQDQGSKWKRRPTPGALLDFWQGCNWIDFYDKNCIWGLDWTNHKLRTNVNSVTFCHLFLLNETVRFVQNGAVSYTVHKKKGKPKTVSFWWHCGFSSSPGHARQGKKKIFLPPVFTDFLPLKSIKKTPIKDIHLPKLSTCWTGGRGAATRPSHASPLFFYKYRGDEEEKGRMGGKRKKRGARQRRRKR